MRRLIWVFAGLVGLALLSTCRDESWRQKLTVTVTTPQGEVSAYSVTEITKKDNRHWWVLPGASGVSSEVRGEAVALEVLPGKWFFALLDGREDGKGKVEYLVYPAFALDKALDANGSRSYEASMAKLHAQPYDTPAAIPLSDMPLLVTFDDISDPMSMKLVDPADLDAAFGCEQETGIVRFPWRDAGQTRAEWAEAEVLRLSRELAAERAGIPEPAAAALEELFEIVDRNYRTEETTRRSGQLRTFFTREQQRAWETARWKMKPELLATLPTSESLTRASGGPCFRLKEVTLAVTREAVTDGRVEAVIRWLNDLKKYRTDPNNPFTNTLPREIGYLRRQQ